jgi:hypothetical protein
MTKDELVEFAKRRLTPVNPLWAKMDNEIAAAIPAALHLLAERVMRDEDKRVLLQQDYALNLGGDGKGLLSAATATIAGDILPEGIWFGRVVDADGKVLWPLKTLQSFYSPQPTFKGYYGLFTGQVWTRGVGNVVNGAQDVQGANGPLTITASFVPANVGDVPATLTDDLVADVVEIVSKGPAPAPAE